MRRRDLIARLRRCSGSVAAWRLRAAADAGDRLSHRLASQAFASYTAAFRQRLSETGYVDEQNLAIEHHWVESHCDRSADGHLGPERLLSEDLQCLTQEVLSPCHNRQLLFRCSLS